MKSPKSILKFAFFCLLALIAAVALWPFAVAGMLAFALSGMKFNRWVSSGAAVSLVVFWRMMSGVWIVRIGDSAPEHWYFEILPGIVSWAIAVIFVSAFAQWPEKFREGRRETAQKESEAQQGVTPQSATRS